MMATTPGWADHAAPRGPSAQATLLPAPVTGSAYKGEPQRDGGRDWQTNERTKEWGWASALGRLPRWSGGTKQKSIGLFEGLQLEASPSSVLCVRQLEEAMHALPYQKWC